MPSKFRRAKLLVLNIFFMAAITPLLLVSSSGYTQTPSEQKSLDAKGASDHLNSVTTSEECSKPTVERQGAWFCQNITPAAAREIVAAAQRDLGTEAVSNAEIEAASTDQGHCTLQGCWTIMSRYRTYYVGGGSYGYGRTVLGDARMYFQVSAKGRKLTVGPTWFRTSGRGTRNPVLTAEVLYISAFYPQGNRQSPKQEAEYYLDGLLAAGNLLDWSKPYPAWFQRIQVPTVSVEAAWEDPSSAYPGVWYIYAKSIKFKRNNRLAGQYFIPSDSVPKHPAGAGWHPY